MRYGGMKDVRLVAELITEETLLWIAASKDPEVALKEVTTPMEVPPFPTRCEHCGQMYAMEEQR